MDANSIQEYQNQTDWVIQYQDDSGVWKMMEDDTQREFERDLKFWIMNQNNFEKGVTIRYSTRKSSVFHYTVQLNTSITNWEQFNDETKTKRLIRRVPRSITLSS